MNHQETQYIPYQAETRVGRGKVLVFAPHPDDEIFGCAGALYRHVVDEDEVRVIILTDGAFGRESDAEQFAMVRRQESRSAAKILGYNEPIFWGLPDRGLLHHEGLAKRAQEAIEHFLPDLIYAPSWWEIHPDHVATSRAITAAFMGRDHRCNLVMYEVGVPLHANLLLDITDSLRLKRSAMRCFASQLEQQAYDVHVLSLNRYRTYTLPRSVRAAEAYRRIEVMTALPSLPLTMRLGDADYGNPPILDEELAGLECQNPGGNIPLWRRIFSLSGGMFGPKA